MDKLINLAMWAFKPSTGRAPAGLREFITDHYIEFSEFRYLVAREIFNELEQPCLKHGNPEKGKCKVDCPVCYNAIRAKFGYPEYKHKEESKHG